MGLFSKAKSTATDVPRGYIILNVIRFCNIVCLLSSLASSAVMLVKTFVVSKFFFFDATSHVLTGLLAIALLITETPLFRKYFMHNWPLLSIASGFVTLGVLMLVLGTLILGNLNKTATSEQSLGTSFWQLLIASGIITMIFGLINIVVNYLFRKRKLNITARMVRAYGASAGQHVADIYGAGPANRNIDAYNAWHEKTLVPSSQPSYENFHAQPYENTQALTPPREGGNAAAGANMQRSASVAPSTVPSYYGNGSQAGSFPASLRKAPSVVMSELGGPYARSVSPLSHAGTEQTRWPGMSTNGNRRSISAPVALDPDQFKRFQNAPDIKRPDSTAHPALRGDASNYV